MPSKKRKYNARFPAGRIKKIMRIDDEIGKVALPVPVIISRALELFVSNLLKKSGDITIQRNARTLTLTHLKQCIYSDSRLDFLKELMKNIPDVSEECNDTNSAEPPVLKKRQISNNDDSDEEALRVDDGDDAQLEHSLVSHLLNGCTCRVAVRCGQLTTRLSPGPELVANLSAARLLFTAQRRGRATGSRCPTVEEACAELLSDSSWTDRTMDVAAAAADRYESYAAACALSEVAMSYVALSLSQARLVDKLLLRPRAAVSVFTRVLGFDDRAMVACSGSAVASTPYCRRVDSAASAGPQVRLGDTKTLFLNRLADCWSDIVDVVIAAHPQSDQSGDAAGLSEVVRLWKTVFAALPSTECQNPDPFYSQLPRLERLLYRTDTDPLLWLDAVRLFGAGLKGGGTSAVAGDVTTGFTRRRLLYFMGKMLNRLERPGDRERVVQETVLLAVRSLRVLTCARDGRQSPSSDVQAVVADVVDCVDSYVKSAAICGADVPFVRWLVRLMRDRDDAVVECLTCALDVVDAVPSARRLFDPFAGFVEFLACVSFDADVLLDFLISDENDFLPCALKMLKSACRHAEHFFRGCGDAVHDTMGLLIRLRLKILRLHENRVFPYDITPIARLIQRCDELYSDACPS